MGVAQRRLAAARSRFRQSFQQVHRRLRVAGPDAYIIAEVSLTGINSFRLYKILKLQTYSWPIGK
jgi:hypothetical protein